jgi:Tfp pilus assembly protein PilE
MIRQNSHYSMAGKSLIELIVTIAIVAVLLSLVLPAIQKVRARARGVEAKNHMRQLTIASGNFAATNDGKLPSLEGNRAKNSIFTELIPHLGGIVLNTADTATTIRSSFLSPADPSIHSDHPDNKGDCSYALNSLVFENGLFQTMFGDGTSNTLLFTTHYAKCKGTAFVWSLRRVTCMSYGGPNQVTQVLCVKPPIHRGTIADPGVDDIRPVPGKTTGRSEPSVAGLSFQPTVHWNECDYRLPQALQNNLLDVAMADGSVRTVRQGVEPWVFWSAVTPNGGEVLPGDW